MFCFRIHSAHLPVVPLHFARGKVRRECVQSREAISEVVESLVSELHLAGYSAREVFAARMSLEEGIVNAIKHGHQGDASKPVWVNFCADESGVVFQVEDQGDGFDPNEVPDPCAPENLERPCGRGLLLIRSYMSQVCHNATGNCVCFCKHRQSPGQDQA